MSVTIANATSSNPGMCPQLSGTAADCLRGNGTFSKVALADVANMATGKLVGRSTAGSGAPEELTVGGGLSLSGGTLDVKNYAEGTWTPTFTSLTTVGSPTITGRYTRIGRMVYFTVKVVAGTTTAAVAGTTYHDLPVGAAQDDVSLTADRTTLTGIGSGTIDSTNDRNYPAGWASTADTIIISGQYEV